MEMLAAATGAGVEVGFNSNATLLHRGRAEALVDTGLDWLHVSLDGATAATYEGIRSGANFDAVVANLAGLVEAKRAAGSAVPWIRVVFVAMRRNVGELPDLVRLLAGVGVNELRVQNLSHTFSDADPAGQYRGIREFTGDQALWTGADARLAEEAFAAAREAAREHRMVLRLPGLASTAAAEPGLGPACTWPWDAAYITSTGVVQPCCMVMGDDRVALGRLDEQSFPQIWHDEPYRDFRRRLVGSQPPEVCVGCALYQRTF
jgi:radical SAM protein with 4Fe4S-binding SPASM domain